MPYLTAPCRTPAHRPEDLTTYRLRRVQFSCGCIEVVYDRPQEPVRTDAACITCQSRRWTPGFHPDNWQDANATRTREPA